jgi:hypothetical protein
MSELEELAEKLSKAKAPNNMGPYGEWNYYRIADIDGVIADLKKLSKTKQAKTYGTGYGANGPII